MIIKNFLVFLGLLCCSLPCYGQSIDSLKEILRTRDGLDRVDILCQLSYKCLTTDRNASLRFGVEAYKVSRNFNDSLQVVRAGRINAAAWKNLGEIDSAIVIYKVILPISKRNKYLHEQVLILNAYALALTFKAQYDKALRLHFESLNVKSAHNDSLSISITLHNIGLVYYKLKDYSKALHYYNLCYALKLRLKDSYDSDILLLNMGLCYSYLQDFDKANWCIQRGLEVCGNNCLSQRLVEANFAYGIIGFMQSRYDEAEARFQKSFAIAKALGEIRFQLDNIDYLAQIFIMQDRDSLAGYYLNEGEKLILKNTSFNLEKIKIYSRLAQLNIKTRNYEKASNYQLKHSELKENVYSEEMTNSLMKAEADFLERENAIKISMQEDLIRLKEEVLQRQALLNKISAALILICVVFVMLLYRNYQQKKILNVLLNKKIAERTRELQVSRDDLELKFRRRDVMTDNMLREVAKALGTIRGLCLLGMKEDSDSAARSCIERIDATAGELRKNIERPLHDHPYYN